ncbi:MAG: hypothetical protein IPK82_22055 [Polyangiaceae bacterium]|nr:hypothetical protein [Polyangiaceae bacterium]
MRSHAMFPSRPRGSTQSTHPSTVRVLSTHSPTYQSIIAALLTLAASTLIACGSPRRDDCKTLSTAVNVATDRIEKAQATPLDPHGLKALADALEKSGSEVEALKLTTPDTQKLAKDYVTLVRDTAKSARAMAASGEAGEIEKAKGESQNLEKLVGGEPKLVADINKFCAAE